MINQDDNMGLSEQLIEAQRFLKENVERTLNELDQINVTIKYLEEELKEVNSNLTALSNDMSNVDLFSPVAKSNKEVKNKVLINQKTSLENKIKELEINFHNTIQKKNSIENLINCFQILKFKSISESDNMIKESTSYNYENSILSKNEIGLKILETQENERKRIARDLHDSVVQNMTSMMHKTELCTKLIDVDPIRAKLELQTMVSTIKSTINDMRSIIYNLRPMSLDDLGLIATIEKYIIDFKKNYEVNLNLKVNNEELQVLPVINLTLFRIIQEATSNAMKHGKATTIKIEVTYSNEFIELIIHDNGIGFKGGFIDDSQNNTIHDKFTGYGLSMMKERVLLLSGDINIESNNINGTKILVKVPLRKCKEDI
jgi:two-component system, NarL family, sensor histidine kinase DegS